MRRTIGLVLGLMLVTGFSAAFFHSGSNVMTSDHPLYAAKIAGEEGVENLAPDDRTAVEAKLDHADKRAAEADQLADENKSEEAEETANTYTAKMRDVNDLGNRISDLAQKQEVDQLVAEATQHHAEVLSSVYEKVPEQAQTGIQNALDQAVQGYENAVNAMEQRGEDTSGLGDISDSIPSSVQDATGMDLSDVGPGSAATGGAP